MSLSFDALFGFVVDQLAAFGRGVANANGFTRADRPEGAGFADGERVIAYRGTNANFNTSSVEAFLELR